MVKTATKIRGGKVEIVDFSLLLLGLDKIKQEANKNLGGNEGLKKKINSEIDSILTEKRIETVGEKVNDLAQIISESPEMSNSGEIGVMAKIIELATEELARQHPKEVEELKKEEFKKSFDEEAKKLNPNLSENQAKNLKEYRDLVAENYFGENILDNQKNQALEANSQLFGPGRMENAWTDLRGITEFLRKGPEEIRGIKEKYNSIKDGLRGVNLPGGLRESRSFEKIMEGFNNPNTDQLFSRTKKYLGWADKIDKLTGGWFNKTITDAGLKMVSKIGNQAVQEFATNALGQIAQLGFKDGATAVLNGILSGGVNAAATTTATGTAVGVAGGAAGTAAAAGGTAVAGAAGTTAAVAGGAAVSATGVGAIVVAALAAAKVVKDAVGKMAEKLGINTKKFFEENFGKVGGKIIGGIASVVALPALLLGAVSAVVIGPILILVFGGLFGYQIMQGSLVSSLVPPKGAVDHYNEEVPIGDDYDLDVGTSGDIVIPPTPINFTRQDLINVAMSLKKNVYYEWGGEWNCIGPCPNWGDEINPPKTRVDSKGRVHYYDHKGVDCSGFVRWSYLQLTKTVVVSGYADGMYDQALRGKWQFVNENDLKPGDIAHRVGHVALYIGRDDSGNKLFLESYNKFSVNLRSDTVWVDGNKPMSFTSYLRPNITFYNDY